MQCLLGHTVGQCQSVREQQYLVCVVSQQSTCRLWVDIWNLSCKNISKCNAFSVTLSDSVRVSESNSIWFVLCLNAVWASKWTALSPFLFCASLPSHLSIRVDIGIFSGSDVFLIKKIPKEREGNAFSVVQLECPRTTVSGLYYVSTCQQYQVCPEGSCFIVMLKTQDNNTTCVIFLVLFSTIWNL